MARMPYPPIGLWLRGYGKDAIPSYWFVVAWRVCQNSLILKKSQSPDFHKPGLCYV